MIFVKAIITIGIVRELLGAQRLTPEMASRSRVAIVDFSTSLMPAKLRPGTRHVPKP
jgi:hypothetical protein